MEYKPFFISNIIKKSLTGELTAEELHALENWKSLNDENQKLYESFLKGESVIDDLAILDTINMDHAWENLLDKSTLIQEKEKTFNWKIWIPLIASCMLVVFYFINPNEQNSKINEKIVSIEKQNTPHENDISPATTDAILILDNGEKLELKDLKDQSISSNIKLKDNFLQYDAKIDNDKLMKFNTLVVPKGGYYKLRLSDGTNVWVNAMSKLKFPEVFNKAERRVELSGEAYFEVAKDGSRPFIVTANDTDIKVLGTHFNVNAYTHKVRTTLTEGVVDVRFNKLSIILQPGEFAESGTNVVFRKGKANLYKDLSWYNNEFYFEKDNIKLITDELSKWYDLDIQFGKDVKKNKVITGSIDRNVPLSQVIDMLEYVSDLSFEISGNKLIIENK